MGPMLCGDDCAPCEELGVDSPAYCGATELGVSTRCPVSAAEAGVAAAYGGALPGGARARGRCSKPAAANAASRRASTDTRGCGGGCVPRSDDVPSFPTPLSLLLALWLALPLASSPCVVAPSTLGGPCTAPRLATDTGDGPGGGGGGASEPCWCVAGDTGSASTVLVVTATGMGLGLGLVGLGDSGTGLGVTMRGCDTCMLRLDDATSSVPSTGGAMSVSSGADSGADRGSVTVGGRAMTRPDDAAGTVDAVDAVAAVLEAGAAAPLDSVVARACACAKAMACACASAATISSSLSPLPLPPWLLSGSGTATGGGALGAATTGTGTG